MPYRAKGRNNAENLKILCLRCHRKLEGTLVPFELATIGSIEAFLLASTRPKAHKSLLTDQYPSEYQNDSDDVRGIDGQPKKDVR